MPSKAFDTGWDFGPVLGLIDSDLHIASPTHSPTSRALVPVQLHDRDKHEPSKGGIQLGDFDRIFKELGLSDVQPLDPASPASPVEPALDDLSSLEDDESPPLPAQNKPTGIATEVVSASPAQSQDTDDIETLLATVKLDKKARKAERKQIRKEAKRERKKQAKSLKKQLKEEQVPNSVKVADSVPTTPAPSNEPAFKQTRYPLRSNYGAKIRPATPVQLDSPVPVPKQTAVPSKQEATAANSNRSPVRRPALANPSKLNPLAPPITLSKAQEHNCLHQSAPPHESGPARQTAVHGTPVPLKHASLHTQHIPAGYFTPQPAGAVGSSNGLIPRTVQPVVQPRTPQPVAITQPALSPHTPSKGSRSFTIRPQLDRHFHFFSQLMYNFPEDKKWLVSPMQLCNEKLANEGIHVFVDASNIMIGFRDTLRKRGVQYYDLSFDSLALLMERRRPVAKRVSASSHREAAPLPHVTKLVDTSKAVGYENNVKEQVYITREDSERRKFFKDVDRLGWTKATQLHSGNGSGTGSDSEMKAAPKTPSTPKWVEQGVDEILHLKMCQSIIDVEVPTTIVLATGDGAQAEHSDGFLAHVERALKKGWKVELLSWKQQMNNGYRNKHFRAKWAERFRIIELDDFLESLVDTP